MGRITGKPELKPIVKRVATLYGISDARVTACNSLYTTRAAFRLETDNQTLLIKPFRGTELRLGRIVNWTRKLQKKGFHHMPKWKMAKNGQYWIKYNNRLFYMTDWVNGQHLANNPEHLHALGQALAELHRLSQGLPLRVQSPSSRAIVKLKQQNSEFLRNLNMVTKSNLTVYDWFRNHGSKCAELANEAWDMVNQRNVQRALQKHSPTLLHGDVTRPNVIVTSNGLYLVDWDYMRIGSHLFELTKTLVNTASFTPSLMQAYLNGYETKYPLSMEERMVVSALFRLPREAWYVAKRASGGHSPKGFSLLCDSWTERLTAIEWLDTWVKNGAMMRS